MLGNGGPNPDIFENSCHFSMFVGQNPDNFENIVTSPCLLDKIRTFSKFVVTSRFGSDKLWSFVDELWNILGYVWGHFWDGLGWLVIFLG